MYIPSAPKSEHLFFVWLHSLVIHADQNQFANPTQFSMSYTKFCYLTPDIKEMIRS
jgi:hypothetical protein